MAERSMTSGSTELLQTAAQALKVSDITLYKSLFERPQSMPNDGASEATQQVKRHTEYTITDRSENEEAGKDLVVMVSFGIRLAGPPPDNENEERPIYFIIEASFLVEYTMTNDIPEDAIKVFAQQNSVHNVWPFWRQHVFDIVQRGGLPHVDVPLFSVKKDL